MEKVTKKLNLSALKKSPQNSPVENVPETNPQAISLGATVNVAKKTVPSPETNASVNTSPSKPTLSVPAPTAGEQKPVEKVSAPNPLPVNEGVAHKIPAPQDPTANPTVQTPITQTANTSNNAIKEDIPADETGSNMISLSSIKTEAPVKKVVNEEKDTAEDTKKAVVPTPLIVKKENTNEKGSHPAITEINLGETKDEKETTGKSIKKEEKDPSIDQKLVKDEEKKLKQQIQMDIKKVEKKKKVIEVDDNIFENYVPKYGKSSKKDTKNEEDDEKMKEKKRKKGSIIKKKRNYVIVAIFLCMLGVGGFFLHPHLLKTEEPKTVIETSIEETKQSVENIIEENPTKTESTEGEENSDDDEDSEDSEGNDEEKPSDTKVKNYLLQNYYN